MKLTAAFRKQLGTFTLDVNLEAEDEVLALLGASGVGKSLALKCIAGIETPDEGVIRLGARTLFDSGAGIDLPPQKRRVGYLFQQYALFPHMTVEGNIAAALRGRPDKQERAAHWVRALRLEGLEQRYPRQLSGGQQQRVALARALAGEPELLLLDEPFSALDGQLKWQLELELGDTLAAWGGTAVYVSHDRGEVCRLCDTVCVLDEGKSQEKEPVADLFRTPKTRAACLLSGCRNLSAARPLGEGRLFAGDWGTELSLAAPVPAGTAWVGIRPRQVRPAAPGEANRLACTVLRVTREPFALSVLLRPPAGEGVLHMKLPPEDQPGLRPGQTLEISLPPEALLPLE